MIQIGYDSDREDAREVCFDSILRLKECPDDTVRADDSHRYTSLHSVSMTGVPLCVDQRIFMFLCSLREQRYDVDVTFRVLRNGSAYSGSAGSVEHEHSVPAGTEKTKQSRLPVGPNETGRLWRTITCLKTCLLVATIGIRRREIRALELHVAIAQPIVDDGAPAVVHAELAQIGGALEGICVRFGLECCGGQAG